MECILSQCQAVTCHVKWCCVLTHLVISSPGTGHCIFSQHAISSVVMQRFATHCRTPSDNVMCCIVAQVVCEVVTATFRLGSLCRRCTADANVILPSQMSVCIAIPSSEMTLSDARAAVQTRCAPPHNAAMCATLQLATFMYRALQSRHPC